MTEFTANKTSGTADYTGNGDPHPAFLVDAIVGAREARNEWQEANAAGRAMVPAWQASGSALVDARNAFRAGRITTAELDAAESDSRNKGDALARNASAALRALRRYDSMVWEGARTAPLQELAAREVLTQHAKVAEALAVIREAYPRARDAYRISGRVGRDPMDRAGRMNNHFDGGFKYSMDVLATLAGFDLAALEAAADGAKVRSAAEIEAERAKLFSGKLHKPKPNA